MPVTRRQFVVVFAGTALTSGALAEPARAEMFPTPIKTARFVPTSGNTISVLSANLSTVLELPYAQALRVVLTSPAPFRFEAEFDPRAFSANDRAVVGRDDHYEVVPTSVAMGSDKSIAVLSFDVPDLFEGSSETTLTLTLPLTAINRYPNDGFDAPHPFRARVLSADATALDQLELVPEGDPKPVTAWGVELSAGWKDITVADAARPTESKAAATRYRYPRILMCRSVGPNPVPAGSSIILSLDADLITSCDVTEIHTPTVVAGPSNDDAFVVEPDTPLTVSPQRPVIWPADEYSVESTVSGQVLSTTITFHQGITSGRAAVIALAVTPADGTAAIKSIVHASGTFVPPLAVTGWPRATGRYAINDMTSSGSPLVQGVAEGTI